MDMFIEGLTARPWLSIATGGLLTGITIGYLAMQRTRKRRLLAHFRRHGGDPDMRG